MAWAPGRHVQPRCAPPCQRGVPFDTDCGPPGVRRSDHSVDRGAALLVHSIHASVNNFAGPATRAAVRPRNQFDRAARRKASACAIVDDGNWRIESKCMYFHCIRAANCGRSNRRLDLDGAAFVTRMDRRAARRRLRTGHGTRHSANTTAMGKWSEGTAPLGVLPRHILASISNGTRSRGNSALENLYTSSTRRGTRDVEV